MNSLLNQGIIITNLSPNDDGGRYHVKSHVGASFQVEADIFKDGHAEILRAVLIYRKEGQKKWKESSMIYLDNDRWMGEVILTKNEGKSFKNLGFYEYGIKAWVDRFCTWLDFYSNKVLGKSDDVKSELEEGLLILKKSLKKANKQDHKIISDLIETLSTNLSYESLMNIRRNENLVSMIDGYLDRYLLTTFTNNKKIWVDRKLAVFSSWYEFFPRNAKNDGKTHGGFKDCDYMLEYVKSLGFNVVYIPPIHPIGMTKRKGKNNSVVAKRGDVGSPWAIGNIKSIKNRNEKNDGGYYSIEPKLGNFEEFDEFINKAKKLGLEIAMDFALNCSPDHPYVKDHPNWFFQRPDGSIRYAENPPKKYEDIYPLNFHNEDWEEMWKELTNVVKYWVEKGIKIFRVDNPHTKPVSFWKFLISEIHKNNPEVIFLAEAFTKPKMMLELAKIGYAQGYSYFTWRNSRDELIQYSHDIFKTDSRHFYRANFWTNTPDILPFSLQLAPINAFAPRLILASLMTPSWGMFCGYEFGENEPFVGKEEYVDSDKYELKARDYDKKPNLKYLISKINKIRSKYSPFQNYGNLDIVNSSNDNIFSFLRYDDKYLFLVVINLDYKNFQESNLFLPDKFKNFNFKEKFTVKDLLSNRSYSWQGTENYVALNPNYEIFAHIFLITQK